VLEEDDHRARRWWLWLLLALVLAAAALAAWMLLRPPSHAVPNVIGARSVTASQILQNRGFEVNVETVVNPEVPRDLVATQRPMPGRSAKEGSTVTIIVSGGPGEAAVPQVSGLPRARAVAALESAGFKPDVTTAFASDVPKGTVISSSPQEGTTAEKGTTVRLTVSKGPQPVTVPNVVGKDIAEARGILEGDGLKVVTKPDDTSTEKPNTVTAQDPKPESTLRPNGTVTLKVAQPVAVPDVTGSQRAEAEKTLRDAGFTVRVREVDTSNLDEVGTVLTQTPDAGEDRRRGSRVTIEVGRLSASATPTPTATPSPTPTPAPTTVP
jgi:serine/threonine-protein kinase